MVPIVDTPVAGRWRGLQRRRRQTDHDPLSFREARNLELFGNVIAPRLGTKRLNTVQFGTTGDRRIAGLFQNHWRPGSGIDDVLVAAGPAIQQAMPQQSADLFDLARMPSGTAPRISARHRVRFAQLNNQTFICDGTNPWNLRYMYRDGAPRLEQWGLDKPLLAGSATLQAGGPLRGRRGYRQSFVNAITQDESELGPIFYVDYDDANGQAIITTPVSLDPQVDRVRTYGTTLDGDGIWLFVEEVAPGATFTDNFRDIELGIVAEEFVNDPPPYTLRLAVPWPQAGVMLVVSEDDPSTILFSDLVLGRMKPAAFPPFNRIPIMLDSGDEVLGLFPYSNSVLVQCRRGWMRITGQPPQVSVEPVQFDQRRTAIGGFGQEALCQVDDVVVNPFLDGAYLMGRFYDLVGGFTTTRLSRPIDDLWVELNVAAVLNTHTAFHRQLKKLLVFLPHGTNWDATRALVFHLDIDAEETVHGGWTTHDYWDRNGKVRGISASLVIESAFGDRMLLGTNDGYLLEANLGMEDDWSGNTPGNGVAYPFELEPSPTRLLSGPGAVGRESLTRFLDLLVRPMTNVSDLPVVPITDFGTEWDPIHYALAAPTGFLMGTSPLGQTNIGAKSIVQIARSTLLTRGEFHAFRMRVPIRGIRFFIESWTWFAQPLALMAREPVVAQEQREFYLADETGGFGQGPFGGGGFGTG